MTSAIMSIKAERVTERAGHAPNRQRAAVVVVDVITATRFAYVAHTLRQSPRHHRNSS